MQEEQQVTQAAPRDLFSVNDFAQRRKVWTPPALRNLILNAEDRVSSSGERIPGNGLAAAGAIVRIGRRVLIDEDAFFRWIADQQKRRPDAGARRQKKSPHSPEAPA